MIQFSSDLIRPGTETQVNLEPLISNTTENAVFTLEPEKRGCYSKGEVNLTHLVYNDGFRYEMNNCIIDEGIKDIIWNCRCLPRLRWMYKLGDLPAVNPQCTHMQRTCNVHTCNPSVMHLKRNCNALQRSCNATATQLQQIFAIHSPGS